MINEETIEDIEDQVAALGELSQMMSDLVDEMPNLSKEELEEKLKFVKDANKIIVRKLDDVGIPGKEIL